jgi:glycosyltransferase involved in cell wall biosynthesis
VGKGAEERRLRALASPSVQFVADLDRESLRDLYRRCFAFVQPGEEDFGISLVEAAACGAPAAALGRGGARDTVSDGVSGMLFAEPGAEGLVRAVGAITGRRFDYTAVRAAALPFARERFAREFAGAVAEVAGTRAPREGRAQNPTR